MRLLFVHMGALGDVILSLPVMQFIRHYYNNCELDLMGNIAPLSLVAEDLGAGNIYPIDSSLFAPLFTTAFHLADIRLKSVLDPIDTIFAFVSKPDSLFVSNLRSIFSEDLHVIPCLPPPGSTFHVTQYQFEAVRHLGSPDKYLPTRMKIFEKNTNGIDPHELSLGDHHPKMLVSIHPGSGSPKKCWPEKCFRDLIKILTSYNRIRITLLFGPAETKMADSFLKDAKTPNITIVSGYSLKASARLLSSSHAHIGNDSGITHLASALGIPTIAIFGPTDPGLWGPMGSRSKILFPDIDCAPCGQEHYSTCGDQVCLKSITAEEVISALDELVGPDRLLSLP